jgi:protein-tyrosine-phosphatase
MAAEQMRHRVVSAGHTDWLIDSAGTLGIEDAPASPEAVEAMQQVGVDLSRHRSQGIRIEHLEWADLLITMTHAHLMELASMFPRDTTDRYVLRAFDRGADPDPDGPDLPDPIGRPLGFYRKQVPVIVRCVDHLLEHLVKRRT